MSVNPTDKLERAVSDLIAANQKLDGLLVQATFFNTSQTVKNGTITLFEIDALGATIRQVFVSFYLAADGAATFTPSWQLTRPGDIITFTSQGIPALATIVTPAAARVYSYALGEIAQGLQAKFRIAQDNAGAANVLCDGICVVLMEV